MTKPGPVTAASPPPAVRYLGINVPTVDPRPGVYHQRHLNFHIDHDQAVALSKVFHGLEANDVRLKNGRRLQGKTDVVRWLLEQVAAASETAEK